MMKRLFPIVVMLVALLAACAPASKPAPTAMATNAPISMPSAIPISGNTSPQTYTVLVGFTDPSVGADLEAFFPATIHIHVGDTVVWKYNAKEIHTVTFLAGQKPPDLLAPVPNAPQGALMFNPPVAFPTAPSNGMYDGSTYANSGIMGPAPDQPQEFSLTFTKAGTYQYTCITHEQEEMDGTIVVEDASVQVPTPAEVTAQGKQELDALVAQVPAVVQAANATIQPDKKNSDGTMVHYVTVGYSQGQIDLEAFFPSHLTVAPGDTVVWTFAQQDIAPHTITFLNGTEEPAVAVPQPQPNGPPLLPINPDVALPKNIDQPLTNQGIYNSGMIDPSQPGDHTFQLKIGNVSGTIPYVCLLHDLSGMKGDITVTAK